MHMCALALTGSLTKKSFFFCFFFFLLRTYKPEKKENGFWMLFVLMEKVEKDLEVKYTHAQSPPMFG